MLTTVLLFLGMTLVSISMTVPRYKHPQKKSHLIIGLTIWALGVIAFFAGVLMHLS